MKSVLLQFEEHDRRIFWIIVAFFVCSLSLYIYFLGVSVFAVIERKGAEQRSNSLTANIMSLESKYVMLNKRIDLTLAHDKGFVEVIAPLYVRATGGEKSFSLRTRSGQ